MLEPDRILEGLARTLECSVLPELCGGFARGQLYAALEVLDSLQGQLRWGGMLLEREASLLLELAPEVAAVVEGDLAERWRAYAEAADRPLDERLREGRILVCELIEAGHADAGAGPLAAAINGYLANDTIFKAMALRPGRLAEISQG